jgi:hypothetical protein
MTDVKFNKYFVTNGVLKSKVHYSPNIMARGGAKCITVYERGYTNNLHKILDNVRNDSDIMTDYFEEDRRTYIEGSKEYNLLLPKLLEWGFAREY